MMSRKKMRKRDLLPPAPRLSREELQQRIDNLDVHAVLGERDKADEKRWTMSQLDRPDAEERMASAMATRGIATDFLLRTAKAGAGTRIGGRKGALATYGTQAQRDAKRRSLYQAYQQAKQTPGPDGKPRSDSRIAKELGVSPSKLARIKKLARR